MPPETQHPNADRRYAVFLSYRHADNKEQGRQWATWLHQVLEGYEIPADLIGTKNSKGDSIPASLYPVFRDEEELPADADLTRNIQQALENSELLVVLCSPRAVESRFVADEIRYFKELGKADRILALMIDGEPNVSDDPGKEKLGFKPETECLPEPLRYGVAGGDGKIDWNQRTEPIAADARPDGRPEQGWTTGAAYREALHKNGKLLDKEIAQKAQAYEQRLELAKLKVVAGSLGVPLGVLTKRDKAMQLRKARQRARTLKLWLAAVGALALLAVAGGIYARFQRQEAVAQREVAEAQRKEALKTASETDFAIADLKLQSDNTPEALAYLSRSLQNNRANVGAATRVVSLSSILPSPIFKLRHKDGVSAASYSPDGNWIVTRRNPSLDNAHARWIYRWHLPAASWDNSVQVWNAQTGKPVGEPMRHELTVTTAIFSPDGKWIVTASWDKTARIWDAQTGKPVGEPMRHELTVETASFSPDGKWIVTASTDGTARVWDAQTGKAAGEPMRHDDDDVYEASFSPDGKSIATVSGDGYKNGAAQVWDAQTGKPLGESMRHASIVNTARFSPDAKWIVTSSWDRTARIWDAQTGKPVGVPLRHEDTVLTASFSPDGKWIITASTDKTARVWDAQTGKPVGVPLRHEDIVLTASFSPDGKWIVTASTDRNARVWDARTGRAVGEPMRHEDIVNTASFSPDGKRIVTASQDRTARVWYAQSYKTAGEPMRHEDIVKTASFSSDGKWIVTASKDNTARVWDAQTGKAAGEPMRHEQPVATASFSPNGKWIVTTSYPDTARVWDVQSGKAVCELMHHGDIVSNASFSPDGKWIITTSYEYIARIWDAQTGKAVGEPIKHDDIVNNASFSPDGKWIVTVSGDKTVRVWDIQTGKAMGAPMSHEKNVMTMSFSLDGKRIVTASLDNAARVWDAQTGEPVGAPMRHEEAVTTASFSPDGKWIVTSSSDKTARVWDAPTGKPVGARMRHESTVNTASFSPDGRWIITASTDKTARVWDAQTGRPAGEPMRHEDSVWTASFSPDGKWIVSSSSDKTARVWDAGIVAGEAPDWLRALAEDVGGRRLSTNGVLESFDRDLRQLQEELRNLSGNDDLSRFGRWFVANPSTRTISPGSSITVPEFVSQRVQENTSASLEEAYRIDPGNPLSVASLAKFEEDKDKALFLCRHALKRARTEGGEPLVEKVRAIVLTAIPDFTE